MSSGGFGYSYSAPTQTTWTPDQGEFVSGEHTTTYYFVSAEQTTSSTVATEAACTRAPQEFIDGALQGTNEHRANHTANPLVWDDNLACQAQRQVDSCVFDHRTYIGGGGYGQNIASGVDIAGSVEMWYSEVDNFAGKYGLQNPPVDKDADGNELSCGHFTAMVWAYSTSLGCASKMCDGGEYIACNYFGSGMFFFSPWGWKGRYDSR